jgi:hypothetical protein
MTDVVADAYITMAELRTYLRVTATTDATDPDTGIELIAAEAAARAIERACHRRFDAEAATATARVYTATKTAGRYFCDIDDLADGTTITGVVFDSTGNGDYDSTPTTAYRVGPTNASVRGLPYTRLLFDLGTWPPLYEEGVEVTAKWGWTAVPTSIKQANLIQAARFVKRRDAAFGVAGSPDMGNELRLLAKLDPDVALIVGSFKRNWAAI